MRTSRSLYFNERRHFTSAVGRKEEEEEEERRRRRRKEKERRVREEKERGGFENGTEERMVHQQQRRRRSIEREDRLELRGDVTYDRKRERAREEEREGMYNSNSPQNFHKPSHCQDFGGNLPRSENNLYTLPHEFQQPESLHSDSNGEKF